MIKSTSLTIKDLFADDARLMFLVGAGCSVDPPSRLADGRTMMKAIIDHACAESEREKILGLKNLRFEQLVESVRDQFDPELKLIDYYGECESPNIQHFFLANMIKKGQNVMTTNFDFLIEYALLKSSVHKEDIIPVITREDFEKYHDPDKLIQMGKKPIYKIHGSTKNIIMGVSTRDSLIATIQAFGSGKEGESVFQVEPFKRPLFESISRNRTLVVMGYSGSDDFDIIPTLKILKDLKDIVWINHVKNEESPIQIQELNESILTGRKDLDKVTQILNDLYQMNNVEHVYRVDGNTTHLLREFIDCEPDLSSTNSMMVASRWIETNLPPPDEFQKYIIPFNIYFGFSMIEDAMYCSQMILELAEKKNNLKWKANSLHNIGLLMHRKGHADEALQYYREALAIYEQLGDLKSKASPLSNIGSLLYGIGQLDEALLYYRDALTIDEQLDDLRGKATRLNNIGYLLLHGKKQLDEASQHFREALTIFEQLGDLSGKATQLNNIGQILHGKGQLDEALQNYKEALAIEDQLGDLRDKAFILKNMGALLEEKGQLGESLQYFRDALALFKELNAPLVEIVQDKIDTLEEQMKN
ncbi:MAG: tetratricopeptide repeat protein [Candidatus Lokiarchaeota archaeon]|nr:tetratricopeptide repeat protein [Candidatus Lokiarchaeota archaeon]